MHGQCKRLTRQKNVRQNKLTVELLIDQEDEVGWSNDLAGLTLYYSHPSEVDKCLGFE